MAKKGNKKSNTKNLIMSVVALVGALIAGVGLFLNVWTSYMKSEYGYADASVKLFNEDLANCDAAFCARVFEVLAIVVVIAIIASVVLSLVTNKASMITTILNIVALAAIFVAVVCACIFFIANHRYHYRSPRIVT